jgi:hypothetical protein
LRVTEELQAAGGAVATLSLRDLPATTVEPGFFYDREPLEWRP